MHIKLAHSPDPDDAFMFYALAKNLIVADDFVFEHVLADIETLNQAAFEGKYEITAVSLHAFAYLTDKYWLLPNGASIGKGYGPIVIAKKPIPVSELSSLNIAVPGKHTTASLTLSLAIGKFKSKIIPFDQIIDSVLNDDVDAGLLIHEGQLTYSSYGLVKLLDLGEWWEARTGLPLPLGVDVVRKDLGRETANRLGVILEESIRYAMAHEDDALDYAVQFGRGIEREKARTFVRMYVNERTLRYSAKDREAVMRLLNEAYENQLLPNRPQIEWVDSADADQASTIATGSRILM